MIRLLAQLLLGVITRRLFSLLRRVRGCYWILVTEKTNSPSVIKRRLLIFRGPCFAIEIPSGDPLGRDCMEFVRSLPYTFPNGTQGGNFLFCSNCSFSSCPNGTQDVLLCFICSMQRGNVLLCPFHVLTGHSRAMFGPHPDRTNRIMVCVCPHPVTGQCFTLSASCVEVTQLVFFCFICSTF